MSSWRRDSLQQGAGLALTLALVLLAGCAPAGEETSGSLGRVKFRVAGADRTDFSADRGRVWAQGAREGLSLRGRDGRALDLEAYELRSTAPEVIQAAVLPASDEEERGRAYFEALAPGSARLELYNGEGELWDWVDFAVDSPELALSVTELQGYPSTRGRVADGLGEPGLVLVPGSACLLHVGLASGSYERLDGSLPLQARVTAAEVAEVSLVEAAWSNGRFLTTLRVSGLAEGSAELVFEREGFEDRLPLQVAEDPALARLQLAAFEGASALGRSVGRAGDGRQRYLIPRAFDALDRPIHGLSYTFILDGFELQVRSERKGAVAPFLALEEGEVEVEVQNETGHPQRTATETYWVEGGS